MICCHLEKFQQTDIKYIQSTLLLSALNKNNYTPTGFTSIVRQQEGHFPDSES